MVFVGIQRCNEGVARRWMAGASELESTMKVVSRLFLIGAFAAGSLAFTSTAQAGSDLSWSLTVGTPGAVVGVMPPAPVYYGAPVYYDAPVYVQPYPVYRGQPHYYRSRPHVRGPRHMHRYRGAAPRHGHRARQRWHHHR